MAQERKKGIYETRLFFASDYFSYKGHKFSVEYLVKPNYSGILHYKLDEPSINKLKSFPTTKTLPVDATIDDIAFEFEELQEQNVLRSGSNRL